MKKLSIAVAVLSLSIAAPAFACPESHEETPQTAAKETKDTKAKETAKASEKAKDAKPAKAKDAKPADKAKGDKVSLR
jgi:Flp pilus assembly protein TadB